MREFLPKSDFKIDTEDLNILEDIFSTDLPSSPIDIDHYEFLCFQNENSSELFNSMLEKCIDYTVDVGRMEKYARENKDDKGEDFDSINTKRTNTHNAMISSINALSRSMLENNILENTFIKWDPNNRSAYGKFAIRLTLNYLKNILLIDIIRKKDLSTEINLHKLRLTSSEKEILVIDYVDILCTAEKEDRSLSANEIEKLEKIEQQLEQSQDKILSAFHDIYIRRY